MAAQIADEFLVPAGRTLENLEPGSEAWVSVHALAVDLDRPLYVTLRTEVKSTPQKDWVKIRRDPARAYHVDLAGVRRKFEARDQAMYKRYGVVVPIESVSGLEAL